MPEIIEWANENIVGLTILCLGLTISMMVIGLIALVKSQKITDMYQALLRGQEGENLEALLLKNMELSKALQQRIETMERSISQLEAISKETVRHVGIVRFNAFENVGSDQSFAVAMLNDQRNGVVISSLYGRELSQVYAKPIQNGTSSYLLSDEEKEAIAKALSDLEK
ncbi:conserved hypothetical protein [Heliomicrobium modesticaldum Ice1]|uniref:DUF4446 domain-containing protein n=1 Tax=Heliobacterium modesticaldum (strain ATCC 51547 / Ice1) TaxID=498761 RepID=B0TAA9_HELMI|nr:DUF4446 family protein [Heliomicrobium modesticaldum]ABZ83646.1 conserved hypothetical protein [Heliomicrobium modesticaldum Ice1]